MILRAFLYLSKYKTFKGILIFYDLSSVKHNIYMKKADKHLKNYGIYYQKNIYLERKIKNLNQSCSNFFNFFYFNIYVDIYFKIGRDNVTKLLILVNR